MPENRPYTPEEQAQISQRYPGIVWVDGRPYTTQENFDAEVMSYDPTGTPLDYQGNPVQTEDSLVPAHTTEGRFPWEFAGAMVGAPALAAGAGALFGGGAAASAGAPSLSAPIGTTLPQLGPMVGLSAPGVAAGTAAPALGAPILGTGALVPPGPAVTSLSAPAAGGSGWASRLLSPDTLGTLGETFGKMSGAATSNRAERDEFERRAQSDYEAQQYNRESADRQWEDLAIRSTNDAFRNALRAGLAQNVQDVNVDRSQFRTRVPNISLSGVKPSAIGPVRQEAGAALEAEALRRLLHPPTAPEREPLPRLKPTPASTAEKVGGPLGFGLTVGSKLFGGK